jgi:hypothetical protein
LSFRDDSQAFPGLHTPKKRKFIVQGSEKNTHSETTGGARTHHDKSSRLRNSFSEVENSMYDFCLVLSVVAFHEINRTREQKMLYKVFFLLRKKHGKEEAEHG